MAARPRASARLVNARQLQRALERINPSKNRKVIYEGLIEAGELVADDARSNQIYPGGKGPPLPKRLTSRTGTGRRSIRVDRGGLPFNFVSVGTDLLYMALHERGTSRLPKRAFLEPALNQSRKPIREIFVRRWRDALRKEGALKR